MEMVQKYDVKLLGLKIRQQLYRQAFDTTISLYEMQTMEQMQAQTTIWFYYGQRMSFESLSSTRNSMFNVLS